MAVVRKEGAQCQRHAVDGQRHGQRSGAAIDRIAAALNLAAGHPAWHAHRQGERERRRTPCPCGPVARYGIPRRCPENRSLIKTCYLTFLRHFVAYSWPFCAKAEIVGAGKADCLMVLATLRARL